MSNRLQTPEFTNAPNLPIAIQITNMVLSWLQGIIILYLAFLSDSNKDRLEHVQQVQQKAVENTQTVKETLEAKTTVDAAKSKDDAEATRTQLYGNWKALDWLAETPEDKKKAGEARKVYEEFQKKHPPK